jgi:ubiquinone/menaquinone biosynthesis C-methylase UbiE
MHNTLNTIAVTQCRLCKADLERQAGDRFLYDEALSRCSRCQTIQLNFTVQEQEELYPTFNQKTGLIHRLLNFALQIFNVERKCFMQRAGISFKKGTRHKLLDLGCGAGSFLKSVAKYFEVYGQEPFSFNDKAVPELKDRIYFGPLEHMPYDHNSFDVITIWQALEHMENPRAVLRRAHALLKEDGKILVSLPNIRSWQAQVFRDRWFHLVVPRHVCHFDQKSIHQLLQDCGFRPTHTGTFTFEYGLSGWAQSLLNSLFEKDLFYEWVKARGEFERSTNTYKTALVAISLVLAVSSLPIFVVLEWLSTPFARGAVLNIVAEKERA